MTTTIQRQGRQLSATTLLVQIGLGNILAISGGRKSIITTTDDGDTYVIGVALPVSANRSVEITLDYDDTYRVRRIRQIVNGKNKGHEIIEAEQANIYCDEVGEVAYRLSCWR